jgi:6-pyruvoyltetrahydropterin/6-carboxytetrahydropterin synthase
MLIDFGHLKSAVKETIELLDHSYLNDIAPFTEIEPSAEHIARFIFQEARKCLGDKGSLLYSISVWESDSSKASYFE